MDISATLPDLTILGQVTLRAITKLTIPKTRNLWIYWHKDILWKLSSWQTMEKLCLTRKPSSSVPTKVVEQVSSYPPSREPVKTNGPSCPMSPLQGIALGTGQPAALCHKQKLTTTW